MVHRVLSHKAVAFQFVFDEIRTLSGDYKRVRNASPKRVRVRVRVKVSISDQKPF